jgi:hypothetical protein
MPKLSLDSKWKCYPKRSKLIPCTVQVCRSILYSISMPSSHRQDQGDRPGNYRGQSSGSAFTWCSDWAQSHWHGGTPQVRHFRIISHVPWTAQLSYDIHTIVKMFFPLTRILEHYSLRTSIRTIIRRCDILSRYVKAGGHWLRADWEGMMHVWRVTYSFGMIRKSQLFRLHSRLGFYSILHTHLSWYFSLWIWLCLLKWNE